MNVKLFVTRLAHKWLAWTWTKRSPHAGVPQVSCKGEDDPIGVGMQRIQSKGGTNDDFEDSVVRIRGYSGALFELM